jgi:hypothetical protein
MAHGLIPLLLEPGWCYHEVMKIGLYVVLMIFVVVAADILFFRHRLRERLLANAAIVLVFLVFYLLFLRHK